VWGARKLSITETNIPIAYSGTNLMLELFFILEMFGKEITDEFTTMSAYRHF